MILLQQAFAQLLDTVRRPGDFYAAGRLNIFMPRIEVAGVGAIALPLLPAQARDLTAVAEQAPYGRGADTVVDTEVRRTWQIDAGQVQIAGSHWQDTLADIVARCATGLGVPEPVSAELYKVLMYDAGGFFLPHRDTEKVPGMFATLVLSLPSDFKGGELGIRHGERDVLLDMACREPSEVVYAAFYADCRHEVRPVSAGHRLVLIFNLVRREPGPLPQPPAHDREAGLAAGLLQHWQAALATREDGFPEKLIYSLKHAYTPASIGFSGLKGADAAAAKVLIQAAGTAACDLHLALVSIEETGSAEYTGSWRRRRYRDEDDEDDDDFEMGEVFERDLGLSDWRLPDDTRPALAKLPFVEDELCPPGAFENEEPDELNFFEATGNAGATFERSYRRAALVLWPKERTLDILAGAGLQVSVPWLADLARRWAAADEDQTTPLRGDAHHLATAIIAHWPERGGLPDSGGGQVALTLSSLALLEDGPAIAAFLSAIPARGGFEEKDNEAIADAMAILPPEQAADLLERILSFNALTHISACADLLHRVTTACTADTPEALARLEKPAKALVAALPGDPARAPKFDVWRRVTPPTPELVSRLISSLGRMGNLTLGQQAVAQFLAWPETYPFDDLLVPAALELADQDGGLRSWPPILALAEASLSHLEARIALPLAPPTDFARENRIGCRCAFCTELAAFLASPVQKTWVFKAAEANRQHVEASIRQHRCDVDTETLRHSRPYELRCTKNEASYHRRVVQRESDQAIRARLAAA